jgi:hypothetical protein
MDSAYRIRKEEKTAWPLLLCLVQTADIEPTGRWFGGISHY